MSKRSKISFSKALRARSSPYPALCAKVEWGDPHIADAFRIDELSPSEKKAFQMFGLDPQNPYHWTRLVSIFSDVHFRGRQAGRPPKWSSTELSALLRSIAAERRKNPRARDADVYRVLARKGGQYAGRKLNDLKYGHRLARDPDRNETLRARYKALLDEHLAVVSACYADEGLTVSPTLRRGIEQLAIKQAIRQVGG